MAGAPAAAMVKPGDRIRVRGERWRVMHVTTFEGCSVAELGGAESSNAGHVAGVLLPFEPVDRISAISDRPRVVRAAAWRRVARAILSEATPSWRSLAAAARARFVLFPYQLEPALAIVRGRACRVLLADEVGLGKTIQAGVAIAELLARERDTRVLIVTPAGLREQWRDELRDRFSIEAHVVDSAALARSTTELPAGVNPWTIPRVAITSIDFVKRPDVIRSLEPLVWDLVAFDEAHTLSGRSDRALAAELVAHRARRVLSITATPHNGDDQAFDRLCNLGRLGAGDRLLTFRRSRADVSLPRNRSTRMLLIRPTQEEAAMHRALDAYAARVNRDAPAHMRPAARLAMIVLARRACSSAASLARSVERRIALLAALPDGDPAQLRLPLDEQFIGEDDEPIEELAAPGLSDLPAERRCLERILALARAVRNESKVRALTRLLRRAAEPAIVFTEYRDTLRHLAASLRGDMAMLHGGLTIADRAREARRFTHGRAKLLLATDAASEGLNLHQRCRLVVNLDVPWTPLRLEQRVGRVDRLGQQRRVHAVTFVAQHTPEVHVASALATRTAQAERGAPFRATGGPDTTLSAEAVGEAERLAVHRALAAGRQSGADDRDDRSVVAVIGRGRREVCLALRLTFLDSSGALVWTTVAGARIPCGPPPNRGSAAIRRWLDAVLQERAMLLASVGREAHQAALDALRLDLRQAVTPALARELAIVEQIQRRTGLLAAPLVQPGLFDRRAIRNAAAQRDLLAEATMRAQERALRLERLLDVRAGERHVAFAAAWLE